MIRTQGCLNCGSCRRPCSHPECQGLERCTRNCPQGLVRRAGEEVEAAVLAERLLKVGELLDLGGGGFTLSGGEPLAQPAFALELAALLRPHHLALETSGFCRTDVFERAIEAVDLVMIDLKHMDPDLHARGTGVDNGHILENLEALIASGRRFAARVPLIPGYNDTEESLAAIAARLKPARDRVTVELLPQNPLAGAKYPLVGRSYQLFNDPERSPRKGLAAFQALGIDATVL